MKAKPKTKWTRKSYAKYRKGDHWKKTTTKMKRKYKSCYVCGTTKWLVTHHITYKNIGREREGDLVVLCQPHHQDLHNGKLKLERKGYVTVVRWTIATLVVMFFLGL